MWIRNAAYPADPPQGITYIYAHACRYHLCPLSAVRQDADGRFTVLPGDTVEIVTTVDRLHYRVCGVGTSPRSGPVTAPDCGAAHPDLMIVTCRYDTQGRSSENIIIAASLADPASG